MGEAVALGQPEEPAPVFQEPRRGEGVDPGRALLGEDGARRGQGGLLRRGDGQEAKLDLVLGPVQPLIGQGPGVRGPGEVGHDVHVVGLERHQALRSGCEVVGEADHPHPNDGVRAARLGIALEGDLVAHGQEVHDGEGGDARLIELEERDGVGVRGPGVGLPGAGSQLLLVHPVEPAVEHGVGPAAGEPGLAPAGEVEHVEVVLADEGDATAVRRELRELLLLRRSGEGVGGSVPGLHQVQVPFVGDEQPISRRGPGVAGEGDRRGVAGGGHLGPGEHDRLVAVDDVQGDEVADAVTFAQVGEPPAVGVPAQVGWEDAGEGRVGGQAVGGELLEGLREPGARKGGQESEQEGEMRASTKTGHERHLSECEGVEGCRRTGAAAPRVSNGRRAEPNSLRRQGIETPCRCRSAAATAFRYPGSAPGGLGGATTAPPS